MSLTVKSAEKWLKNRPYLKEIAALPMAIEKVLSECSPIENLPDNMDSIEESFKSGVPVLRSGLDFHIAAAAGNMLIALSALEREENLPEKVRNGAAKTAGFSEKEAESVINYIINGDDEAILKSAEKVNIDTDLLIYLAWHSVNAALRNIRGELEKWSEEHLWQHGSCPVCGNSASSALLKRTKRGRQRFLHCEHCGSEWSYVRIGCPYCGNTDQKKISIKESPDEPDIRLDLCHECKCYIKTYVGDDKNTAGVNGWAAIHMDMLMKESGFAVKGGLIKAE